MSVKPTIGDKNVLQKRTPTSQRYSGVKSIVESGATAEVVQYAKDREVKLRKQPGELFKRFATSRIESHLAAQRPVELLEDGGYACPMDEYRTPGVDASGDTFLILDCRDAADYEACHITSALHYPTIKLNHSTNPFLPEMYAFKNKEHHWIVMYDLEEEMVLQLANTLYQKGIDNVGIIAGGLREFVQDYATSVVGVPPVPIIPRDSKMQRRADEVTTLARSEARSTVSNKPKGLSTSLARPQNRCTF